MVFTSLKSGICSSPDCEMLRLVDVKGTHSRMSVSRGLAVNSEDGSDCSWSNSCINRFVQALVDIEIIFMGKAPDILT